MDEKEAKKNKETLLGEQRIALSKEGLETAKKSEKVSEREKIITDQLRREIEAMELDENLKEEAKKKAEKIGFLAEDKKIDRLLEIADEKGVIFAVKVAEDMKDPFILDTFHDILAKEGYYKKFTK